VGSSKSVIFDEDEFIVLPCEGNLCLQTGE
jgi:hypothetical protein